MPDHVTACACSDCQLIPSFTTNAQSKRVQRLAATLRRDPARLTGERARFLRDMRRRFNSLLASLRELVATEDAFGLLAPEPIALNAGTPRRWQFMRSDQKLKAFNEWFKGQIEEKILTLDASGNAWTGAYVRSAYKRGLMNSFLASRKTALSDDAAFTAGTQAEFLRSSFGGGVALEKLELLGTRTYEQLRGVTAQMSSSMSRILAQGIADGKNPYSLVKDLAEEVGFSFSRAARVARTELMHAHAEGQLDAYEKLGVKELGVLAEWSTAGDDRVCPMCIPLQGAIFTIKEARGLIPRHPNCRCTWIPANVSEKELRQIRSKPALRRAMAASLKKETGAKTEATARAKSRWIGAGKRIRGKRSQFA